ncbi:MAG: peptidyl-prolyl cis-trans isomerase SurA [Psychromonas sp.]|jgi:peptidyl-prolyl cis-trans isomerase SurA|uniref:peptidylprolyl isomerase SurA n=1 Tax=Psychromonas sp. TaxID=1884585 RepID=UPI0039E703D6
MKVIKNIILPLLFASLSATQVFAEKIPLDKIEAVVNQEVILSSDLQRTQLEIQERYKNSDQTLPTGDKLTKQILDKLITDRLQLQIAERIGLRINDAQVQQTVQQTAEKDGLTSEQLQAKMEKQGKNYAAFVETLRDELTINEVRQIEVRRRISISDQEVEQMVKRLNAEGQKNTQFNFVHILFKLDKESSAAQQQAVEKKAQDLLKQLKQGADASQLALLNSQGPKATEGGNWGWRTINEMPTLFADVFNEQQTNKGDIIGPFKSDLGLHIIKIIDKKGAQNVMTVEVNARHILIKSNIILSDDKAQKLLAGYRQDIISGKKSFAALAREYSQDPGSAVKGGQLGWADPSMYVPEFKQLALSLPVGEISQPFRTMHGWHILEVMGKRKSDTTEQATKQKAYSLLFQQRFPAEVYAWMNEIRQEAYIKINNPNYIIEKQ